MFKDKIKAYQYKIKVAGKSSSREAVFFPPKQYLTPPVFPPPDFMPFLAKKLD